MKQQIGSLIFLSIILSVTACCNRQNNNKEIETIRIKCDESVSNYDISNLFEDSLEVIKLESTDQCLLSARSKILFVDNLIISADQRSGIIGLFDARGNYIRNIGRKGRGPGEYFSLGDVTVHENLIYVQDSGQDRIIVYDLSGNYLKNIELTPPVFYVALTSRDQSLYFITNYIGVKGNEYNVVETDLDGQNMRFYLPFQNKIEKMRLAWGLNNYISDSVDDTLLILSRCDTVYSIKKDCVEPRYLMDFGADQIALNDHIPGAEILRESIKTDKTSGLSSICNSKNYLLGTFGLGEYLYYFIYDKIQKSTIVSDSFVLNKFGGIPLLNTMTMTADGYLVLIYEPYLLKTICERPNVVDGIIDDRIRVRLADLAFELDDDMNPVCIKIKIK